MSDADEQIKATIVADGNLGATISTPSQDLKANIDSQGNLVANRLSIGPDSIIDNLSNVTMTYPIKDNSFLQYNQSLNSWHNSDVSIEQTIDDRKTEVYEFRKRLGYLSDNHGLGQTLQTTSSIFSANATSYTFSIPPPKVGYGKRQKLKLRLDYTYSGFRSHPAYGLNRIRYEENVSYSERNTLPIALLVESVATVTGGPFTGQKDFYIRGNHLEKLNTITGRISLSSNTGSTVNPVTGIRFQGPYVAGVDHSDEGYTIVTAIDNNGLVSAGDRIYYSNNNFVDGNFVAYSTPIHRTRYLDLSSNVSSHTNGMDIIELSAIGQFTNEYEVLLPETNFSREVVVRIAQMYNTSDYWPSGSLQLYLHEIYGIVENV